MRVKIYTYLPVPELSCVAGIPLQYSRVQYIGNLGIICSTRKEWPENRDFKINDALSPGYGTP